MQKERPEHHDGFNFSEREKLYTRISHQRLIGLLEDSRTRVHEVQVSTNMHGEFMFVTLSRIDDPTQRCLTFWGLGFHEHREHWIAESWEWYDSYQKPDKFPVIENEEALVQVREQEDFVRASATPIKQSREAQLYEFLAELTDEDAALSELEDLGWMLFGDTDELNEE